LYPIIADRNDEPRLNVTNSWHDRSMHSQPRSERGASESDAPSPPPCGLERFADRVGDRAGAAAGPHAHPRLRAVASVVVGGYVAITATLVAVGLLLTKVLLSGPVGSFDDSVTSWFADHRTSALDSLTNIVSRSADTLGAIGIAILVSIVLAIARRWRAIVALFLGLALELAIFLAANFIVDRPRPEVVKLGSQPSTSSFPSGHSAATTVIYLLVAVVVATSTRRRWLRALAWCAAVIGPAAVALSRVYRGMHHPTDVVAGVLVGIAALTVALIAVRAERTASPSPHRGAGDDRQISGMAA